jgi:hypothetical protein
MAIRRRKDGTMAQQIVTGAAGTVGTAFGATTKRTRALLACGVAAGPVFMAVGLTQAFTRAGFDPTRHALSLLENGSLGWIQISNFVVTGLLVIAAAVGVRRVLGRSAGGTCGPRLVAVFGAGMISAGAFRADPADGFPPGTPGGQGEVSVHGALHMASFGVSFLCLIAACFVAARALAAIGRAPAARASRIGGVVMLAAIVASFGTAGSSAAVAAIYVAVVIGWVWLAALTRWLRREPTAAR